MKKEISGMRKRALWQTNVFISLLVMLGFVVLEIISYHLTSESFEENVEHIARLTSESISYQIDAAFGEPVSISLTMANDTLLQALLLEENQTEMEPEYLARLQNYLNAYQEKYGYESVFLVSAKTGRYYHFRGLDRVLTKGNPENDWYFAFLNTAQDYALNIDNDEASEDIITVFVNCRITGGPEKGMLGVVGVGLRVKRLHALLESYGQQFNSKVWLIDENGFVQLSSNAENNENVNLFADERYADHRDEIVAQREEPVVFWNGGNSKEEFVVTQYIPGLDWYLLVENNTDELARRSEYQLMAGLLVTAVVLVLVLVLVNSIILTYNKRLLQIAVSQELEYQKLLQKATEGMYENVFELDITNDRAAGESTRRYFETLGLSPDASFTEALHAMAQKQVREDFMREYLDTFSPKNVLKAHEDGISELYADVMVTNDGESYYWLRIRARLFYWDSDASLRMITFRQNINDEKQREADMLEMAQRDALTGLYNKSATTRRIDELLERSMPNACHALLMIDIDHFKGINDTMGHATGDKEIQQVADKLKNRFRLTDVCGRVGGDEFIVFLSNVPGKRWLENQAQSLVKSLRGEARGKEGACAISVSIGISLYPEAGLTFDALYRKADAALYDAKENGRNRYSISE